MKKLKIKDPFQNVVKCTAKTFHFDILKLNFKKKGKLNEIKRK